MIVVGLFDNMKLKYNSDDVMVLELSCAVSEERERGGGFLSKNIKTQPCSHSHCQKNPFVT